MCIQLNYKETLIKAWFLCGAGAVKVFLMSITSTAHLGLLSSVEFQKRRLVMRCATGPSARNLHKILWNFVWKASAVCPAGCPASAQGSCTPLWFVCSELGADKVTYKMTSHMLCWDGAPHKCQNRPWSRSSSHDSSPVFLLLASMREWGGLWSLQGPSWIFKCWTADVRCLMGVLLTPSSSLSWNSGSWFRQVYTASLLLVCARYQDACFTPCALVCKK